MASFLSQIQAKIFLLLLIMLLYNCILIVLEGGFTLRVVSKILNIVILQLTICATQFIHYPQKILCVTIWCGLSCSGPCYLSSDALQIE